MKLEASKSYGERHEFHARMALTRRYEAVQCTVYEKEIRVGRVVTVVRGDTLIL
jgi:hypothetical protein